MGQYFRITAYNKDIDESAIFDSNGKFDKIWKFSAYLIEKGFKILEVSKEDSFKEINMEKEDEDMEHIIVKACQYGKPNYLEKIINGTKTKIIEIDGKKYIPI